MNNAHWPIRLAREDDVAELEKLIALSVHELQATHYSKAQMEAAIGSVFGVDRQLIRDGTYFVVEHENQIVGCGGWSRRQKLFGSDAIGAVESLILDPEVRRRPHPRLLHSSAVRSSRNCACYFAGV